ncbi:MAG: CDP-glucose 4,6-dehydratase [Parvibaculaceae bacterium]|nr:CDP-glucose 4,6-dehydratase [Parvibaculaceae bacterium]
MTSSRVNPTFWKGRRVLLTGHTGFKGAWTALWLDQMGAEVTGVSLAPEGEFSLFDTLKSNLSTSSQIIDIRDIDALSTAVKKCDPEIALHMAAQALVRRSYREPVATYQTNVMGTVNLLNCLAGLKNLSAALIITSDKVYQNNETGKAFVETDTLEGDDPYSSSKAACEIATASLAKSLFKEGHAHIATARAGNVIGGGDFSEDRLIPDIWRAARVGKPVTLRYPQSTRPWQHVLESVSGYLTYLQALAEQPNNTEAPTRLPHALNFGPAKNEALTVGHIAHQVQQAFGIDADWDLINTKQPAEKAFLALNANLAQKSLGWSTRWNAQQTLEKTVTWYKAFSDGENMHSYTLAQISEYEANT